MKFSMVEIKNNAFNGPIAFDEMVDVSELTSLNNDIKQIDSVRVSGICTVDNDEFIFTFTVEGEMILPCARTLVDVTYPFKFEVIEIFSTSPVLEIEDVENDVHQIHDETLDLKPYIKENIILETPYRVFSDQKALEEGEGWTFREEDEFEQERKDKIDPRFSKLQQLLDEDRDKRN